MSFFSNLAEFTGYSETSREALTAEEIKAIKSIEIVERISNGGNGSTAGEKFLCMCFMLKSGGTKSHYLSKYSDLELGDKVDPKSVAFIFLENSDGNECVRCDGEAL